MPTLTPEEHAIDFQLMAAGELLGVRIVLNRLHQRILHRDIDHLAELLRSEHEGAVADLAAMSLPKEGCHESEALRSYALEAIDRILVQDRKASQPPWWPGRS